MASTAVPSSSPATAGDIVRIARVQSVDLWRGIVMALMALDHVRDYFSHLRFTPEDMSQTYGVLFFTRWLTHLCAPAFFFLAGTGIYFAAQRRTKNQISKFLFTRGLWLIALEWTVVWWGWTFLMTFPMPMPFLPLVIWALGMSMIANSLIVRLPIKWVAAFGLIMIFGHNLLDGFKPEGQFTALAWGLLHDPGFYPVPIPGAPPQLQGVFVVYALVPWIGVMSLGYVFGAIFKKPATERRKLLWILGLGSLALFAVLRVTNLYGNPVPPNTFNSPGAFSVQSSIEKTIILFFNVEKYPPSLLFLLMTLGVGFLAMAWFDCLDLRSNAGKVGRFFLVFGQVPLFYYILHIYLVHAMAIVAGALFGQQWRWLISNGFFAQKPENYGFNLPFIYLVWALCLLILYFPCRWYARYKATHNKWWLSYL